MPKRRLRVLKWIGTTPVVALCTQCNREFTVSLDVMKRTGAAAEYLQAEFERHKCAATESASEK